MVQAAKKPNVSLGFVTVVEHTDLGVTGGLLVVNTLGRPLEFHCTAPVKVQRAQEILYGPTLQPCLYGEQIARALVEKSKESLACVFTNLPAVLALRHVINLPVAFVDQAESSAGDYTCDRATAGTCGPIDVRAESSSSCTSKLLGPFRIYTDRAFAADLETIQQLWQSHFSTLDLLEPFQRIRDAIAEAQKVATVATAPK